MKRERVCQQGDKATPALVRKAGVEPENDVFEELSPLAIQHRNPQMYTRKGTAYGW